MNTIEEKIDRIGDAFRGLWRSKEIDIDGKIKRYGWSVTFVYDGEMVETPYRCTPQNALDYAIFTVRKEGES